MPDGIHTTFQPQSPAARSRRIHALLRCIRTHAWAVALGVALPVGPARASEPGTRTIPAEGWEALREDNRELRRLLAAQQAELAELRRLYDQLAAENARQDRALTRVQDEPRVAQAEPMPAPVAPVRDDTRIIFSGEAGLAWFDGGSRTAFPHSEFRVDEARLFVDAAVTRHAYAFAELDLTTRETRDEFLRFGELYLELADLPSPWGGDPLTVRLGRLDIPFGEEYRRRGVMSNPLISHSLSDIWGIDEGIEVFGRAGPAQFVLAVQNGSHPTLHDFTRDKSVTARLGWQPHARLHASLSAMRTGEIDAAEDELSELWIGNGFFRAIGAPETTTRFHAELAQADVRYTWPGGHLAGAYGRAWYDDNDSAADNRRRLDFFSLEAQQFLTEQWYGAARYSRLETDRGYPIVGQGTFGEYFFSGNLTDHLWRLGVGIGYEPADHLRFKFEYTRERGRLTSGAVRDETDLFAAEAGLSF